MFLPIVDNGISGIYNNGNKHLKGDFVYEGKRHEKRPVL